MFTVDKRVNWETDYITSKLDFNLSAMDNFLKKLEIIRSMSKVLNLSLNKRKSINVYHELLYYIYKHSSLIALFKDLKPLLRCYSN